MIIEHSEQVRNLWHKFFTLEESFLEWVNLNTTSILSLENKQVLSYTMLMNGRSKAPKNFRHICALRSDSDVPELLERMQELKDTYLLPVLTEADENQLEAEEIEKLKLKFPNRFPEFYSDVKQVNLSVTPAYSSKKITIVDNDKDEELLLKSYSARDSEHLDALSEFAAEEKKMLIKLGLKSVELYKSPKVGLIKLLISTNELIKLAGTDSLQLRRHTGDQFRARVFKKNGDMFPVRFGFMILDKTAPAYNALPQSKRAHALELAGTEFELPISSCNYRIWFNKCDGEK